MAATFELEIATPDRLLIKQPVSEAQIPAANGYIGVLPEHAPLISELGSGELSYLSDGRRQTLAIDGGWVEVLPAHVRVLANHAERANEVDVERAQKALKRAEERLANPGQNIDIARALNAMKRAQARLAAAAHK